MSIIADGRWAGNHGIGRFSFEVLSRLKEADIFTKGPKPLSIHNLFWQPWQLKQYKKTHAVFFTPGFNPVWAPSMPYVLTLHDLIHLFVPGQTSQFKRWYYEWLIKPSVRAAYKVLTVSEYSKQSIIEWAKIPESQVVVVGNGVSCAFTPSGECYQPGYPYLLHVGNARSHKNVERLLQAFATAKIDKEIKLILTAHPTIQLKDLIQQLAIENRIVFTGSIDENKLAALYRGALALLFPSLYEGFGLPVVEAMACGTPVITANATSLPEVAGEAAIYVDPYQVESIAQGIEKLLEDSAYTESLKLAGITRAMQFSWDKTAERIQEILNTAR